MNIKWIKIVTDIFDDEKIKFISTMPNGDELIVIWFRILCLCGKSNQCGMLMFTSKLAYTEEMLSSLFGKDVKIIQYAMKVFEQLDMIHIEDSVICVTNWEKHQNIEGMEKIREQNRIRQKKWYDTKKALPNVILTQPNATEKEIDIEEDKDINNKKRFQKPSFEEVKAYCCERKNDVDAQSFVDFYESKGWKIGKNPMKDWKAAVRTWERRNPQKKKIVPSWTMDDQSYDEDEEDVDELKKQLLEGFGKL